MTVESAIKTTLKRDRALVLSGVIAVTALAWIYLINAAAEMGEMAGMVQIKPWSALDAVMMFVMWSIMMIGMMVPSAAPVILLYALVWRKHRIAGQPYAPTGAFAAGYVTIWTAFSLGATTLQWGLERAALLSPMMVSTSSIFGGLILIAAGLYQLTPYKNACLRRCRSPVEFLSRHWRPGAWGAFMMGLEHGAFCLGCCWILMVLLFVGGVMNLLWVATITLFVLVEKVLPFGRNVGQGMAGVLVLAGIIVISMG
jgi:predicted metal-binding membrane protein